MLRSSISAAAVRSAGLQWGRRCRPLCALSRLDRHMSLNLTSRTLESSIPRRQLGVLGEVRARPRSTVSSPPPPPPLPTPPPSPPLPRWQGRGSSTPWASHRGGVQHPSGGTRVE
ncbi:unnamed protein product, partial [Laminaria digitata]